MPLPSNLSITVPLSPIQDETSKCNWHASYRDFYMFQHQVARCIRHWIVLHFFVLAIEVQWGQCLQYCFSVGSHTRMQLSAKREKVRYYAEIHHGTWRQYFFSWTLFLQVSLKLSNESKEHRHLRAFQLSTTLKMYPSKSDVIRQENTCTALTHAMTQKLLWKLQKAASSSPQF